MNTVSAAPVFTSNVSSGNNFGEYVIRYFSDYHSVLKTGNWLMLVSAIVMAVAIVVCYTHVEYFPSMYVQVIGHMSIILFAGLLKIGYVMRCIGRHGLGERHL